MIRIRQGVASLFTNSTPARGDVLADILKGEPVTIGFNRQKGGLDVLVPLDLQVVESTVSESGFVHRRFNETLLQFSSCVHELAERAKKQLKAK